MIDKEKEGESTPQKERTKSRGEKRAYRSYKRKELKTRRWKFFVKEGYKKSRTFVWCIYQFLWQIVRCVPSHTSDHCTLVVCASYHDNRYVIRGVSRHVVVFDNHSCLCPHMILHNILILYTHSKVWERRAQRERKRKCMWDNCTHANLFGKKCCCSWYRSCHNGKDESDCSCSIWKHLLALCRLDQPRQTAILDAYIHRVHLKDRACTHPYIHIYVRIVSHPRIRQNIQRRFYPHNTHACVYTYIHICIFMHTYIHTYVLIYTYTYIYSYK